MSTQFTCYLPPCLMVQPCKSQVLCLAVKCYLLHDFPNGSTVLSCENQLIDALSDNVHVTTILPWQIYLKLWKILNWKVKLLQNHLPYCKSGNFRVCNFSCVSDFWHFCLFLNSRFSAILHRSTHKINTFVHFLFRGSSEVREKCENLCSAKISTFTVFIPISTQGTWVIILDEHIHFICSIICCKDWPKMIILTPLYPTHIP